MSRFLRLTVCVTALATVGCGGATAPTPPRILSISCPAPAGAPSLDGNPVAVSFGSPVVTGGEAPVVAACAPASGGSFPVGSTPVTCTAHDARQQAASCTFTVTISRVPRLSATRFVAFGDSITEGLPHACAGSLREGFDVFVEPPRALRPPPASSIAYPERLQAAFAARYTAQTFTVINEGSGGEDVTTGAGDLPRVLSQDAPQVLLLQEGTNDLDVIFFGGVPSAQIAIIVNGLRTMIREGRGRGLPVFVGTLTPQRENACRGYAPAYVAPANEQIRALAASEGATLVDLYQAFGGIPGDLIGSDGLHPNEAGYQRIADAFFAAIKDRLEN